MSTLPDVRHRALTQEELHRYYAETKRAPFNCHNCQHYKDDGPPDAVRKIHPYIVMVDYCERALRRWQEDTRGARPWMDEDARFLADAAQDYIDSTPGTPNECAGWELREDIRAKWRTRAVKIGE